MFKIWVEKVDELLKNDFDKIKPKQYWEIIDLIRMKYNFDFCTRGFGSKAGAVMMLERYEKQLSKREKEFLLYVIGSSQ